MIERVANASDIWLGVVIVRLPNARIYIGFIHTIGRCRETDGIIQFTSKDVGIGRFGSLLDFLGEIVGTEIVFISQPFIIFLVNFLSFRYSSFWFGEILHSIIVPCLILTTENWLDSHQESAFEEKGSEDKK